MRNNDNIYEKLREWKAAANKTQYNKFLRNLRVFSVFCDNWRLREKTIYISFNIYFFIGMRD